MFTIIKRKKVVVYGYNNERYNWGGTTFSASHAIRLKPQIYIAKGSAPWYSGSWMDSNKVINIDESIPGQATVTCDGNVTNLFMMFDNSNFTSLDLSSFDTSNATDMSWMFNDCNNLTTLDVSNFNTSKVTDMNGMFNTCSSIATLDLSSFNTSKVTNMTLMFGQCSNLITIDVSNFDTSNVTEMYGMFGLCSNLTTIKGVIDMKSCTNYDNMFAYCSKLSGVKIKNPPSNFESKTGLSKPQYTIVS